MRLCKTAVVHGCILLAGISCRAAAPADDHFHGDTIPVPPAQREKWTPPAGAQKDLAEVAGFLFEQGMADPRGCEYRQIKVATGNVWGNWDDTEQKMTATMVQTHGWVLPADGKSTQRFAVCWNGLVYPVLAVGDPCSVEKDMEAALKPPGKDEEGNRTSMMGWDAPPEGASVAFDTLVPLKSALLLRLGKADLASAVWNASFKSMTQMQPKELSVVYDRIADIWLFSLYNRAVCAWMRRDDDLALASMRQLAPVARDVKKKYQQLLPRPLPVNFGEDTFDFLDQVPAYLADMERRRKEVPHISALALGRNKFPDKAAWIKALIADLGDVSAPQDGQPGWPRLDQDSTVQALVAEGNDAVDPLIDALAHDQRFSRTVHFWRDFAPDRTILAAYELEYSALQNIFQTNFFDVTSTGEDLTNSGPEARAKVVAAIRAYWKKRDGRPQAEQWFITLADPFAKREDWGDAAEAIAKSGLLLRDKKNPSVTELLEKRITELSRQKLIADPTSEPPVLEMLDALLTWDPKETEYARGICNEMFGTYVKQERAPSWYYTQQFLDIAERVAAGGDLKILDDYAGWLRAIPPEKIVCGFAGNTKTPWFRLLWEHQDVPSMQKTAEYLFTDKDSPWLHHIQEKPVADWSYDDVLDMMRSPLVGVPAFRSMLLAGLADQAQAGVMGFINNNQWDVRLGDAKNFKQLGAGLNPLDPLSKNPPRSGTFRTCDFYAWAISDVQGMPVLEFYWPQEKRDAAIRLAVQMLERYGVRYNVTQNNPPLHDYRHGSDSMAPQIWFPKPGHPATQADVENGLAIFALPPEATPRTWEMPQYPLPARWLALKDFSENAGHGDELGRQWMTTDFKNEGLVWQAEEGFIDGKWQRFFAFAGSHHIERVPAEEIEFPDAEWHELENGIDCHLSTSGDFLRNPLRPGASLAITLKLRNRRGIDQGVPDTLYKEDARSFAAGVDIHLYRRDVIAPGEIVKETGAKPKTESGAAPGWTEVPPKVKEVPHFAPAELSHLLSPTGQLQVMSFKLDDFYDLTTTGDYYIEMTFDPAKVGFTAGTSNYVMFRIAPASVAKQPEGMLDTAN